VYGAALALGGATLVSAIGLASLSATPSSAATINDGLDCSTQVSATNNICVDGGSNATSTAGGVLTVTATAGALTLDGVYNDFLGSLDTSTGAVSFPANQAAWVSGLVGTLSGVTAKITISDDGTVTGTYNPSTGAVTESGTLTVTLDNEAAAGAYALCTYTQPFLASGTLSAPKAVSSTVSMATGTVTQGSTNVALTATNGSGLGCGLANAVLNGATQTLTLPVTAYVYSVSKPGAPTVSKPGVPTKVTTNVVYSMPLLSGWNQQQLTDTTTIAASTVNRGSDETATITPMPMVVPTSTDGLGVSYIDGIDTMIPMPANASYVTAHLSGADATFTGGPPTDPSGSIPVTLTECTSATQAGCTATAAGSAFGGSTPLPYLEASTPASTAGEFPAGSTVVFPTVTLVLDASGGAGSTITLAISEFSWSVDITNIEVATIHAWPSPTLTAAEQAPTAPEPPNVPVPLVTAMIESAPSSVSSGYRLVAADGGMFDFGKAPFYGSMGGTHLNAPVVGMADAPGGGGYWEVAADGGIFSFGDAPFYGSMGGTHLNAPIVGMAAVPGGGGYWEVAADGGIFSFGDAPFYGSMGATHLNAPVVGMAAVPGGGGYWEVAADGGIFSFGDAPFYGSMGATPLNKPVVGMAAVPGGGGYWEVAADGGIFSFGDAPFYGSMGATPLNKPVVGMATTQLVHF